MAPVLDMLLVYMYSWCGWCVVYADPSPI